VPDTFSPAKFALDIFLDAGLDESPNLLIFIACLAGVASFVTDENACIIDSNIKE